VISLFHSATTLPAWAGAPEWLSTRVLICAIVAVALAFLGLVLKGMQKIITLLVAAVLILGIAWFVQDTWTGQRGVVPPELSAELNGLAQQALKNPEAKAAWARIQSEWTRLSGDSRARLTVGGDRARMAIAKDLDAKAAELRRNGKKSAADELMRLRSKLVPTD
jgi:hypothetical protein